MIDNTVNSQRQIPETFTLSDRLLSRRRMVAAGAAALTSSVMLLKQQALAQDAAIQPAAPSGSPPPSTTRPDKGFDFKDDNPLRGNDPRGQAPLLPGEPGKDYKPVIIPNGWALPYKVIDGVKVYH